VNGGFGGIGDRETAMTVKKQRERRMINHRREKKKRIEEDR
jgi:hypothetical protein